MRTLFYLRARLRDLLSVAVTLNGKFYLLVAATVAVKIKKEFS